MGTIHKFYKNPTERRDPRRKKAFRSFEGTIYVETVKSRPGDGHVKMGKRRAE